jgi:uncharacterized membrane protein
MPSPATTRRAASLALALLTWLAAPGAPSDLTPGTPEAAAKSGASAGGGSFSTPRGSSPRPSSTSTSTSSRTDSSPQSPSSSSTYTPSSPSHATSSDTHEPDDAYDATSGGGSGDGDDPLHIAALIAFFIALCVALYYISERQTRAEQRARDAAAARGTMRLAFVEVAVQANERDLQHHLEGLAAQADLDDPEGLHGFLGEVLVSLRRKANAIDYAHLLHEPELSAARAEAMHLDLTRDARVKYDREVLRNHENKITRDDTVVTTDGLHDEDGDFNIAEYFVVSLSVGWDAGPTLPNTITSGQELSDCLDTLGHVTRDQLRVVELIWSPAAPTDNMGKQEMLMGYPELGPL